MSHESVKRCRSALKRLLDVYTVIFSFALDDERAHSPDEFFRLSSFRRGQLAWTRLFERIGADGSTASISDN